MREYVRDFGGRARRDVRARLCLWLNAPFPARGGYLPPSLRLDWLPRDVQDGSKRASDSARWPPRWSKVDCGRRVKLASDKSKRRQDGPKT
eukprot:9482401-Pyramimonas_sp.AAC.1